jgi:hypothetical protein
MGINRTMRRFLRMRKLVSSSYGIDDGGGIWEWVIKKLL